MAADIFAVRLLMLSCLLRTCPSESTQTGGYAPRPAMKRPFRSKRQGTCVDGSYEHEGHTCCLCAAGQRLVSHCNARPDNRKCESCGSGTYSSHPTSQTFCAPCTSCDHPNANQEQDEACSPAQDSTCRCKPNHYCSTEICKLCNPCKECGPEGVKVACTSTNNTVCNGITEGDKTAVYIGIFLPILLLVIVGAVLFWWKRKRTSRRQPSPTNSYTEVNLQQFNDLHAHLPDIAQVLGWKDMKDIAIRSRIPQTKIDSCHLDHPHESQEQTLQLLMEWVEKEGSGASKRLIQILQKHHKRGKAERVMEILKRE